jgi:hypothetical protein
MIGKQENVFLCMYSKIIYQMTHNVYCTKRLTQMPLSSALINEYITNYSFE